MKKWFEQGLMFGVGLMVVWALIAMNSTGSIQPTWTNPMVVYDHAAIAVDSTTPTQLTVPTFGNAKWVKIQNMSTRYKMYIGNSDVVRYDVDAATNTAYLAGYELDVATSTAGRSTITLSTARPIYAITQSTVSMSTCTLLMGSWQ